MVAESNEEQGSGRPPAGQWGLAALAASQDGVVSLHQIRNLGIEDGALEYRLRTGSLHRVRPRVYAVGHRSVGHRGWCWAALLTGGPQTTLSYQTGAACWDLIRSSTRRIDVTVPGGGRRDWPELRIHRTRSLHPEDVAFVGGLAVTSVPRTLLDLAAVLPRARLERAIEQACLQRLFDRGAIECLLERNRGHRGRGRLASLALAAEFDPPLLRSELERLFLRLCARAGLPTPATNVWVAGQQVDALWEEQRLAVELDSWGYHRTPQAFERDPERSAALLVAGYRPLRITYRRLTRNPQAVVRDLRRLLFDPVVARSIH